MLHEFFTHRNFKPKKPFTKMEAVLWLELTAAYNGGRVDCGIRTMAEEWGWSYRATQAFMTKVIQFFNDGSESTSQITRNDGRIPRIIEIPGSLALRSTTPAPANPPTDTPLSGGYPPGGGVVSRQEDSRKVPGGLGLTDQNQLAFDGKNLKVSKGEFRQMEQAYPEMNLVMVFRQADKSFPARRDKKLTAEEYLERCLSFRWREGDQAKSQQKEAIEDGGPLAAATSGRFKGELPPLGHEPAIGFFTDQRLWWRQYGAEYLAHGEWSTSVYGPKPWEPETKCPEGLFTKDETINLRRIFDDINEERTRRERNRGSRPRGEPQDNVPAMQPSS